ncbi:MAG: metal-dependent transcriptional regulator [Verrucomicrobiota bacterium]
MMTVANTISASSEDYLEAIFHIITEKQAAKPNDIAKRLKVSNASVTGALRALATKELIRYAPYEVITLTSKGKVAAKDVVRRHEALKDFFVEVLSVRESLADEAACKMEHAMPRVILEKLVQFSQKQRALKRNKRLRKG